MQKNSEMCECYTDMVRELSCGQHTIRLLRLRCLNAPWSPSPVA